MVVKESTLPVGTTDKLLDTTEITQEDGTKAHREAVFIADPIYSDRRVQLGAFNFGRETRYAASVTGMELKLLCEGMERLIEGQRLSNLLLNRLIGENLTIDDLEGD